MAGHAHRALPTCRAQLARPRGHAASLHVLAATPHGTLQESYRLPINRVFEDRTVRLAGLDQDGRDKIIVIVIESDALRGASVMVLGLYDSPSGKTLKEKARSLGLPFAGSTQ